MNTTNYELEFHEVLDEMLSFIKKNDISSIKQLLINSTSTTYPPLIHKGLLFEHLIAILISSNSNHAYINPLVKDEGNNIFVYTKNYKLIECIQAKNTSRLLNSTDIDIEVTKHKKSKFKNYPFKIISVSGFNISSEKRFYYENKNIVLEDFTYISNLINSSTINRKSNYLSIYFLKDSGFINKCKILIDYNIKNDLEAYARLPEDVRNWCTKIRNQYKNGKLDIKKKLFLDSLNFYWSNEAVLWDISFNKVKCIFKEYGSTYLYVTCPTLRAWIKRQIKHFKTGNLSNDKFIKLNQIHIIDEWLLNINLLN